MIEPLQGIATRRAAPPAARIAIGRAIIELRQHGVTPTPLSILAAVTDSQADEDLAAQVAAVLHLNGKEEPHDPRCNAGGITRG